MYLQIMYGISISGKSVSSFYREVSEINRKNALEFWMGPSSFCVSVSDQYLVSQVRKGIQVEREMTTSFPSSKVEKMRSHGTCTAASSLSCFWLFKRAVGDKYHI